MKSETAVAKAGNWLSGTRLTRVEVVVCTPDCTLEGATYRMADQRLLDSLCSGFSAGVYRLGRDFLPLTDVQVHVSKVSKESMAYSFVMKAGILFVAERGGGQPEMDDLERARKWNMKVKMPLVTKLWIPPYTLVGRMHVAMWQELAHILDAEEMFLPMTSVTVNPALPTGESSFSFVAVNRCRIARVGDPPRGSQTPLANSRKDSPRKPKSSAK